MATVRLPVEPLRQAVERRGGLARLGAGKNGDVALRQAYHRGIRQGYVSLDAADKLAVCLLGAHPIELWGDAWLDGGAGLVTTAAAASSARRAPLGEGGTVPLGREPALDGLTDGSAA